MADILKPGTVDSGFKFLGGDPSSPTNWEPEGLKIGTIDQGFTFVGGDPNSQDSWVKQPEGDFLRGAQVSLKQTPAIAKGLIGLAGKTAEAALGEGGVSTAVKDWGLQGYEEGMRKLQPLQKESDELTKAWTRAKDGDLGALVDWAQYGLGYMVGQVGEAAATAVIGSAIGGAVAGPAGAAGGAVSGAVAKGAIREFATSLIEKAVVKEADKLIASSGGKLAAEEATKLATKNVAKDIGATTGLVGMGVGKELGSIYPEAETQAAKEGRELDGMDLARIWGTGIAAGGLEGLTDKLGLGLLSGKTGVSAATKLGGEAGAALGGARGAAIGAGIGGAVGGAALGSLAEGGTEAVQTVLERIGAGQELTTPEAVESYINAAGLGAIGGGGIGIIGGAIGSRARPDTDILNDLNSAKDVDSTISVANELASNLDELTAATTQYLTPQAPVLTPDETIELAAAKGAIERTGSLDLGAGTSVAAPAAERMAAAETALREVEANQGVATPAQAAIIDATFPGRKMYDSVLTGAEPVVTPAGTIEVPETRVPRETFVQGATEAANAEGFAELQARQQAAAAPVAAPAVAAVETPAANTVIAAFATPGAQRTAEQKVALNKANQAYPAEDLEVMQLAATAPFRLDASQKLRLQALRQETAPQLSTPRAEGAVFPPTAPPMSTVPETPVTPTATVPEAVTVPPLQQQEQPAGAAPVPQTPLAKPTADSTFVAQMASSPELTITPDQVRVVDPNELQGVARQTARLVQQIGRVFGKQVVIFDGMEALQADGFVNQQAPDTIFLNTKSTKPHLNVFGHELFHLVKRDSPEIYRAFANVVERNLDEQGRAAFRADYGQGANLEEISSDLIGNRFSDPTFWTDVFNEITQTQPTQKAQGIVARLAGSLYAAVDRMVGAIRGQGFKADEFVKDLQSIKTAARSAMVEYAKIRKIPAMQMETEIAKTKQLVTQRIQGEQNGQQTDRNLLSPTRPDRSGLAGVRGGETTAIPEFGTDSGRAGSIRVQGIHYSPEQLAVVDGNYYGQNVSRNQGAEAGRVRSAKDRRITKRGYFYINTGNGISPEEGVGSNIHTAYLNNMYDNASGLITAVDLNDFESAVLDAGFDGYINRNVGMAVVLGDKQVPVIPSDGKAEAVPKAKPSNTVRSKLQGLRSLPAGELTRERWGQVLKTTAPDVYAELEPTGAFQGEERVYKDKLPLLSRKREVIGDYEISAQKDGSLTVYGNPDEIRAMMPEGVVGRPTKTGVAFTGTVAPRVRAALEGRKLAYSRAGQVLEKRPIKDGKYVGAPEKYNTPGKLPKLLKQLRQLTQEGAAGRYWYENSGQEVLKMVGGDVNEARKFVALLAIYSPQAKVDANTTFALRAWAQYKAGQPISVKTESQDTKKAQAAMDDVDAFWSGEKTGNFFYNLLRQIDPSTEGKQGATIDMWMMRAGEYETDAPTATQYAFMENETNAIARELGWEPQQVQAAIWVAMKARMENPGVKKRTEATSEKKGWLRYDYPVKNGRPTKTRVILDEQKHRDNWLKHAMAHDPSTDDTQTAKFDFGDGLKRHIGQISFEARPGRSTGVLPGIHNATYEQQAEFQQAVQDAFLEKDGSDRLAQLLGLMVDTNDIMLPGVWQGDVSPSSQKLVAMAPAKGKEGKANVDPAQAEALNVYAAIRGLLAYQEGVGWHRPFFAGTKRDANGVDIDLGRQIYPEEAKALEGAINDWMQDNEKGADWADSFAIISSPNGVRLVSFGIIENGQLHSDIVSVAESVLPDFNYRVFASSGDMPSNNWKENPNGESYIQRISAAGRSDVLEWARTVLAPRVQSVFKDYSRKYGWGNPGSFDFAAERGTADQGRPSLSRVRGLESIFEGLNGRGLALTRAKAAAKSHSAAAQIAFVQDNFYDILSELEDSGKVEINCD